MHQHHLAETFEYLPTVWGLVIRSVIACSCRGSIEHTDSFSSKFSPRVNNVSAKICVTPFISYKHIVISMIYSNSLWVGNLIDTTATFAQIWRYQGHTDPSKVAGFMNVTGYGALPVKLWFCTTPLASKVSQLFKVLIVYWFAKWQKNKLFNHAHFRFYMSSVW